MYIYIYDGQIVHHNPCFNLFMGDTENICLKSLIPETEWKFIILSQTYIL